MKVRTVVVWLLEPLYLERGPSGRKTKHKLEFDAVIGDTKSAADQLLKSVGAHPENFAGLEAGHLRDVGEAIGGMLAQVQANLPQPTPGTRWHNGCVEFTTAKGELLVIPLERIAWIELGPETEIATYSVREVKRKADGSIARDP